MTVALCSLASAVCGGNYHLRSAAALMDWSDDEVGIEPF
jgi:hypothetical protein